MSPRFSVIMPAYNAAKVIERAVKSLSEQTCHSYELIIVDDGSKDNTPELCQRIKNTHHNVTIIRQENAGPGKARERGVKAAKGDYVVFLDADDYFSQNAFSVLNQVLTEKSYDILQFGFKTVDSQNNLLSVRQMKEEVFFDKHSVFQSFISQKNVTNYLCNKVFRRTLFDGIEWPSLFYSEDYYLLVQLYGGADYAATISDALYDYVQHEQSAVHQSFNIKYLDQIKAGEFAVDYTYHHYPDLVPEALFYLITHSARLTEKAYLSDVENKAQMMDYTKSVFKSRYKELRKVLREQKRGIALDKMTRIFAVSPSIALYLKKWQNGRSL